MSLLLSYQDLQNKQERIAGRRRNVGWQRISRDILASVGRSVATEDDVKGLKSAIEAHQLGKALINDAYFSLIEKFLLEIDVMDGLDAARTEAARARRAYLRGAFAELVGKGALGESSDVLASFLEQKSFLIEGNHWGTCSYDVVIQLDSVAESILDVSVYFFIGRFASFTEETKTQGVYFSRGFAALKRDQYQHPAFEKPGVYSIDATLFVMKSPAPSLSVFDTTGLNFRLRTELGTHRAECLCRPIRTPTDIPYRSMAEHEDFSNADEAGTFGAAKDYFGAKEISDPEASRYLNKLKSKFDWSSKDG